MKLTFGDIVVVDGQYLGVVVKSWLPVLGKNKEPKHEVYVRMLNAIKEYKESKLQRYMVRHKYLPEDEVEYQYNAMHDL